MITHNRGTIEAADALYGVTVGRRLGQPGDQPPARRGAGAGRARSSRARPGRLTAASMRFFRRRADDEDRRGPSRTAVRARSRSSRGCGQPAEPDVVEPAVRGSVRRTRAPPATAATTRPSPAPDGRSDRRRPLAGDLDAGLQRTRGGFMSRLRGLLGGGEPGGPSWDEVEETLIAGDVGAIAGDRAGRAGARAPRPGWARGGHPRRARRAAGPARPGLDASLGGARRTRRSSSSSASTGRARPPRSASWPAAMPARGGR